MLTRAHTPTGKARASAARTIPPAAHTRAENQPGHQLGNKVARAFGTVPGRPVHRSGLREPGRRPRRTERNRCPFETVSSARTDQARPSVRRCPRRSKPKARHGALSPARERARRRPRPSPTWTREYLHPYWEVSPYNSGACLQQRCSAVLSPTARPRKPAGLLGFIRLAVLGALLAGLARTWRIQPPGHLGLALISCATAFPGPTPTPSRVTSRNQPRMACGGGPVRSLGRRRRGVDCASRWPSYAGHSRSCLLTLRGRAVSPTARDLTVVTAVFGLWARVFVIRPHFLVLFFAALLWSLVSAERAHSGRLWILPLLFGLLNLHGGWIVGLGVLF